MKNPVRFKAETPRDIRLSIHVLAFLTTRVWSAVLAARQASVEAMLRANFDFSKIHTPGSELSGAALSVLEVEEIQGTLFHNRWLPAERDLALSDARLLRDRAARLLAIAGKEEGLELAIVDVALTPVPTRAKPAANNQLGTLNPVEGSQFRAVLTA